MEEQSRKEQLEATITRGLEAQHFVQFIEKEPYFKQLFSELDEDYTRTLLGLEPGDAETFRLIQTKRLALYEPLNRATLDVQLGQKARAELDQPESTGGIL